MEINGKLYSVVDIDDFTENRELYNTKYTAIEVGDKVLPIRSSIETAPGIYYEPGALVSKAIKPDEDDHEYDIDRMIDLSSPKDIGEVIEKNEFPTPLIQMLLMQMLLSSVCFPKKCKII